MAAPFALTPSRIAVRAANAFSSTRAASSSRLSATEYFTPLSTKRSSMNNTKTPSSHQTDSATIGSKQPSVDRGLHRHGREGWDPEKKAMNPQAGNKRFADFDLKDRVFVVTGGARGLGLNLAEALCEAGGKVHCLDRLPEPDAEFLHAKQLAKENFDAELHYEQVDVLDHQSLDDTIGRIADTHKRLDGLIAAAGIQQVTPAIDYKYEDIKKMMDVNYTGVFLSATACARQMMKYKNRGSILLVGSMSGSIANKGLISPVYNSSKAAVVQLGRNLAMEWGRIKEDGTGGIRVNVLSPGHIVTPMVQGEFEKHPDLREFWESENLLGRIADPAEFKGAALFALSNASSFMTGSNLIIDGGHTAW